MPDQPHTYIEHVFTVEIEDGSFGYGIELDGTKYPPAGSFETMHEAFSAGYAELKRLKAEACIVDDGPNPIDEMIEGFARLRGD
ncbi:MAG TPA: hypothetical protein VGN97_13395 [Mesorhizobium sp.]|jgi:hypothetical protein|nr:hypothetical protein [Mesorhizobium sp.]